MCVSMILLLLVWIFPCDLLTTQRKRRPAKPPMCDYIRVLMEYGNIYLFVPTRWFGAISIVSVMDSWRTARPRSAMAHMPFFLTRIFLDLRSRWAMPGLPAQITHHYNLPRELNRNGTCWLNVNNVCVHVPTAFIHSLIIFYFKLRVNATSWSHPECRGSPCGGEPGRWQLTVRVWSCPQWWQSSG